MPNLVNKSLIYLGEGLIPLWIFILSPGTILIFLGAAHQILRQEKKAPTIIMMKTGK